MYICILNKLISLILKYRYMRSTFAKRFAKYSDYILYAAIIFLWTRKHLYSSSFTNDPPGEDGPGFSRRIQKHASLFWHTIFLPLRSRRAHRGSHVIGLLCAVRERWVMSRGGLNKTSAYRHGSERNCPATYRVATGTPKQEAAIRAKWFEAASHSWLKERFVTQIPTPGIAATWAGPGFNPHLPCVRRNNSRFERVLFFFFLSFFPLYCSTRELWTCMASAR